MSNYDWIDDRACSDGYSVYVMEMAFESPGRDIADEAKRLCRRCPVQTDCLNWAIDNREGYGIWGGLTPDERKALVNV